MKLFLLFLSMSFMLGVLIRDRDHRTRVASMVVLVLFIAATYYFVFGAV